MRPSVNDNTPCMGLGMPLCSSSNYFNSLIPHLLSCGKAHSPSSGFCQMFVNVPMCRVPCFHASRGCVEKLNRHCGSGSGQGVVHVQAPDGNST